jgi:hypothetical protein
MVMHAVMRSYSGKGAKELAGILGKNKAEVEKLIRSVKGFVSYSLVHTHDGVFSVKDKAGAHEILGDYSHVIVAERSLVSRSPTHSHPHFYSGLQLS